uniref:Uncharacterized protein n=1 Tax=Rousettus aegyptiacus TaxID=9407 RepID=A0A7J8EJZ8_ROUAE|nr:hypothetical protein HJG63_012486 [Rousettus aegyptiacus]
MNIDVQISFRIWVFKSLRQTPSKVIARSHGRSILSFLRNLHTIFHSGCTNLQSRQHCMRGTFSLHPLQHLLLLVLLIIAILTGVRWHLIVVLICISLKDRDVEHLFIYLSAISMSLREKCLFKSSDHFLIGSFAFLLLLSYVHSLYILDIRPLSGVLLANIFSHSDGCLFTLLMISCAEQKLFSLL